MIEIEAPGCRIRIPQAAWDFEDVANQNADVFVDLDDGRSYVGTLYTLENIAYSMKKAEADGNSAESLYFCDPSMVVLRDFTETTIRRAIVDLIGTGLIERVFERSTVG